MTPTTMKSQKSCGAFFLSIQPVLANHLPQSFQLCYEPIPMEPDARMIKACTHCITLVAIKLRGMPFVSYSWLIPKLPSDPILAECCPFTTWPVGGPVRWQLLICYSWRIAMSLKLVIPMATPRPTWLVMATILKSKPSCRLYRNGSW
jgi:hypothetical protein